MKIDFKHSYHWKHIQLDKLISITYICTKDFYNQCFQLYSFDFGKVICFSWQQWNFVYNIHQSAVCLLFQGSAIQSGPIHRPSVPTISEVGTLSQSGELPNNLASHMPAPDSITTKKYWFLITTYILLNMILEKSILVQVGWVLFSKSVVFLFNSWLSFFTYISFGKRKHFMLKTWCYKNRYQNQNILPILPNCLQDWKP